MKSRVSRATIAGATVVLLLAAAVPAHAEWNKGLEAYNKKDWANAVKEFEEVTKTNPDYAGGYYMLGVSQRAAGQLSPAIASLRKAVELDGSQASYKIALGQALLQAGQYQNAYQLLKPLNMSSMDASHRSSYALLFGQAATKAPRRRVLPMVSISCWILTPPMRPFSPRRQSAPVILKVGKTRSRYYWSDSTFSTAKDTPMT